MKNTFNQKQKNEKAEVIYKHGYMLKISKAQNHSLLLLEYIAAYTKNIAIISTIVNNSEHLYVYTNITKSELQKIADYINDNSIW